MRGATAPRRRTPLRGTQSVTRALALLRQVAESRTHGHRLAELAAAAGLHLPTAHRLMAALVRERFVTFDPYSRLYHIGTDFLLLGENARELRLREHFRPVLDRLAELTEDCVYLSAPSGYDSVCIDRVEGAFHIRTITLDVGSRRPLGVGGGSLALLAALPDDRVDATIVANAARFARYNGMDAAEIRQLVRITRRQGYAHNDGRVMDGVGAVAVAVPGSNGQVVAAVSVAAIVQRMKPARRRELVELIRGEVSAVGPPLDGS